MTRDLLVAVLLLIAVTFGLLLGEHRGHQRAQLERDRDIAACYSTRLADRCGAQLEACLLGNASCADVLHELVAVDTACRAFIHIGGEK